MPHSQDTLFDVTFVFGHEREQRQTCWLGLSWRRKMGGGVSALSTDDVAKLAANRGLSSHARRIADYKVDGAKIAEWAEDDDVDIVEQLEDLGVTDRQTRRAVIEAVKPTRSLSPSPSWSTPVRQEVLPSDGGASFPGKHASFLKLIDGAEPWVLNCVELQGWLGAEANCPEPLVRALSGADGVALFTKCCSNSTTPSIHSDVLGQELTQHKGVVEAHVKQLHRRLTTKHGMGYVAQLWSALDENGAAHRLLAQYAWRERLGEGTFNEVRRESRTTDYATTNSGMHFLNRSQVHKVTRRSDGTACAVSIVHKGKGDKANRELKVLHSLRSKFVVQLLEWATVGNDVLLVVEFLEGKALTDEIEIGVGVKDEIVLWRWAEGIMQGVVTFHSQNIAHHNIRPSNVSRVSPLSAVAPAGPCHRPRRRRLPPRIETEAYQ